MSNRKSLRSWRWRDPVYGVGLELVYGGTGDQYLPMIQRRAKCSSYTDEELEAARSYVASVYFYRPVGSVGKASLLMWFGRSVTPSTVYGLSTIGHEAVHGAIAVFNDKHMPITKDSEEPFAYYQTYLFTEILERLRRGNR